MRQQPDVKSEAGRRTGVHHDHHGDGAAPSNRAQPRRRRVRGGHRRSQYLAIPSSTSSRASLSTSFSDASPPRTLPTDDEYDIPVGSAMIPDVLDTPTKFSVQLPSPSSPSLATFSDRPFQIERAATLPDNLQTEKKRWTIREMQEELKALPRNNVSIADMRRWIIGIAVLEFDSDFGPVVEGAYPPLALIPAESQNLAFCAFPDFMQLDQGSQTHSFRVRENAAAKPRENRPATIHGFIYGFSRFIQR